MTLDTQALQIAEFLGLKPEESVVLIGDSTTQEIVQPLYDYIKDTHNPIIVNIDEFERPLADVPSRLINLVTGKDVCFYAVDKRADEKVNEVTFRRALNDIIEDNGGRVGNMIGVTSPMIEQAFSSDAKALKDLTERIRDYMATIKTVSVTSPRGTEVIFEFSQDYNWLASTGFIQKGKTRNVMPSEVYTHPANVNGTIVMDGTYGELTALEQFKDEERTLARLKKTPIVWNVYEGRIVDLHCEDTEIQEAARKAISSHENAERIGEYGMGTNIGIKKCIGRMMIDEKYPGVHVAHGHGYPKETGAKYKCKVHFDGIILDSRIVCLDDNRLILDKGIYHI